MKNKSLLFIIAMAFAINANAQGYKASFGGTVGTMYGVSYKGFIITDNLGLEVDLGVNLLATYGSTQYTNGTLNDYTFEINPNIIYQSNIGSWSFGDLGWYTGGGFSIGLFNNFNPQWSNPIFKWGINALGGLELGFSGAPVALSFDFRPGYGMAAASGDVLNFFDWKLVAGVRYIF